MKAPVWLRTLWEVLTLFLIFCIIVAALVLCGYLGTGQSLRPVRRETTNGLSATTKTTTYRG